MVSWKNSRTKLKIPSVCNRNILPFSNCGLLLFDLASFDPIKKAHLSMRFLRLSRFLIVYLISICFGETCASSFLETSILRTPSIYCASMLLGSTVSGRVNDRTQGSLYSWAEWHSNVCCLWQRLAVQSRKKALKSMSELAIFANNMKFHVEKAFRHNSHYYYWNFVTTGHKKAPHF
jgi:hypothetical protein